MSEPSKWRVELYSSVAGEAFWRAFSDALTEAGFPTSIVAAVKPEDYRRPRSRVGRLWLRWQLTGGFALQALGRIAWSRWRAEGPTIRIVTTNPFFLPTWIQWLVGSKDRTVFLLFDLYPEALVAAGWTQSGSWLARLIARITRRALARCDATVYLGETIRRYVDAEHGHAKMARVIAVGAPGEMFAHAVPEPVPASDDIEVLYAGVLGRMHEVDTIRALCDRGLPPGVSLRLHATGRGVETLRAMGPRSGVTLGGPLPGDEWSAAMRRAAVGLITLSAGSERVAMPSKTYSALVAGQAIVAVCAADSDLAQLVRVHDCGWVVAPGDVEGLQQILAEIAADRASLHAKRQRAFAAGHLHYDMKPVAAQWLELLRGLAGEGAAHSDCRVSTTSTP